MGRSTTKCRTGFFNIHWRFEIMIHLENYAKKVGRRGESDWYEWEIFVNENDQTLDRIDHVEYLLHPTFPNPRRVVYDRASKFALRTSGWGVFTVKARITFKDGTQEEASHYLDFGKKRPNQD